MKLYHATDISCVQPILEKGFRCKQSREHWLGNGIIGGFTHEKQAYFKPSLQGSLRQMRLFDLPFTETQVCVNPEVIDRRTITVVEKGGADL